MIRTEGLMRTVVLAFVCLFVLSSCATTGGPGEALSSGIRAHAFAVRKVVILGEGVSPETAERVAREAGAMALSSSSLRKDSSLRDAAEMLRAIADSGDAWDVMIAGRARKPVMKMLANMRAAALAKFRGRLIVPADAAQDQLFQSGIRRVFGDAVTMEYVQPTAGY